MRDCDCKVKNNFLNSNNFLKKNFIIKKKMPRTTALSFKVEEIDVFYK